MGSYQSGQMGLTVTQLAYAFGGSNPSLPTSPSPIYIHNNHFSKYNISDANVFIASRIFFLSKN